MISKIFALFLSAFGTVCFLVGMLGLSSMINYSKNNPHGDPPLAGLVFLVPLVIGILFIISGCVIFKQGTPGRKKPAGIALITIIFAVAGFFAFSLGILTLIVAERLDGFIFLIPGIAFLAVAHGIWNSKKWARLAGVILALPGMLEFPAGTLIGIIILYFLLAEKKTGESFKTPSGF